MEGLALEQQELVREIIRKHGIDGYSIEVKVVSGDGDGYLGILSGFNVIDREGNKRLSLVVKIASKSAKLRDQFPIRDTFLREIYIYETVFPELHRFQSKYNIPKPFKAVAKYYGSLSEQFKETLVLQNLKEDNFKLHNRRETLDSHHLSLVMTEYAKLHAITFAMRRLDPEAFQRLASQIKLNALHKFQEEKGEDSITETKHAFFLPALQALEGHPKRLEALKNFMKTSLTYISPEAIMDNGDFVMSHSDCWSTNMLFKYEDKSSNSIPTSVCFIDWQMSSMAHPTSDISYFFYICAGKRDLENYMRYLILYHTVLSESLASFGLNSEDIYPFDTFEKDWKERSKMGFLLTIVMMGQSLSESKTHDFEKMAEEGKDILDFKQRKPVVSELYKKRMGDLVEFLVKNKFI